ncbi:MAG: hypothetical protein H0V62_04020 [Gammaproteobacteria bacterium]|nr:hypothetical protein [Gammaproteobacteria bacterium]
MGNFNAFISRAKGVAKIASYMATETATTFKDHVEENKGEWLKMVNGVTRSAASATQEYARAGSRSVADGARNLYLNARYSKDAVQELQHRVESQGGFYRELIRNKRTNDSILIGGESLTSLLAAGNIPVEIEDAYRAAYPDLSQSVSFEQKIRELDSDQLIGLISGVKGKLFEQKYVSYLNDGNLPDGYSALLAGSANQPGWDIEIQGPNGELASVLQAKATDSLSYVADALERYPSIDVVTTEEVYGHLVMSGVSENIASGNISNAELSGQLENSIDASELSLDFAPPLVTLAFIAFTSYKDESLTLFEKARSAGDRSGKKYLSYLIGGGIAAITNTWWLGVLGSVSSRYMSDEGLKKVKVIERLKQVYKTNQKIINRLRRSPAAAG